MNTRAIATIAFARLLIVLNALYVLQCCISFLTSWEKERLVTRLTGGGGPVESGRNALGQLVWLGYGISTFTPATYRRHRL